MDGKGNLANAQRFSGICAVKNDVFHLPAAQDAVFLFAEYPADGIDNIGFSTAVGANDGGDAFTEFEVILLGKGLKAVNV